MALQFNEKYDGADTDILSSEFQTDLSTLGEHVTARIELEDQLIEKML